MFFLSLYRHRLLSPKIYTELSIVHLHSFFRGSYYRKNHQLFSSSCLQRRSVLLLNRINRIVRIYLQETKLVTTRAKSHILYIPHSHHQGYLCHLISGSLLACPSKRVNFRRPPIPRVPCFLPDEIARQSGTNNCGVPGLVCRGLRICYAKLFKNDWFVLRRL